MLGNRVDTDVRIKRTLGLAIAKMNVCEREMKTASRERI
jgi:hypothetical protein